MQNQTGCKINVSPASGRDVEREIGLVGSRHAIDAAKRAIMDKVDTVVSHSSVVTLNTSTNTFTACSIPSSRRP